MDAIFATFTHDDEKPELYSAVEIKGTNQTVYAWEKKVGCLAEPTMGFKAEKKKSTLSYTIPWFEYTIYNPHKIQKYQYVCYKKISSVPVQALGVGTLLGTTVVTAGTIPGTMVHGIAA